MTKHPDELAQTETAASNWTEGEPTVSPARLTPGTSVGRYEIREHLGSGGMGTVYRAADPRLGRDVAIKLLKRTNASVLATKRLQREAQALAKLSHPNIVAVFDLDTFDDQVFIAMELVDGVTLRDWLREHSRSLSDIVHAFAEAGRGLAAAHEAGLVHRDFKPANVVVGSDGRVRVLDFGLAGLRDQPQHEVTETDEPAPGEHTLTQHGSVMGTPAYMAPEQHVGETAGPAADQFALAVALFEAVYDRHPFGGGSAAELAARVVDGDQVPPPDGVDVPAWLQDALLRGMARNPDERFDSMNEFVDELSRDREPQRRWLLFGSLGAAAVLTGVVAMFALRGGDEHTVNVAAVDACAGVTEKLNDAWNAGLRNRVLKKAPTAAVGTAVVTSLDDYATNWRRRRMAVCRAPDEAHEQRLHCLDSARVAMGSVSRIMSTAGPRVFDSASLVLDNLPVLETCDGPASALRWQTAPIDAAAAAERKRITERAKRAMILRGAGRKKQTKALVTQLTEQLDRLRDPMARAHAARVIAHFQPDRKKAEALFRRAIRDAIIVRDEVTVVNAYADLVANLKDQQRFGDALKEANIAEAHAERMGQFVKTWPSAAIWYPLLSGRIANMRGLIADERGKAEAAIPHYRKTVKLWGRTQKQRPIRLAMALNNLAEVQRKTGRYQEAIANLDKAVAITQKQSSLNTFYYLTMVNNRGMAKLTAGWATRAIADFNLALKLAGKRARAGNIAYNLSLVHTLAEDYAKAETMLARAKTVWLPTIPPEHFVFDLLDVRRCAIARLRLQFAGAIGRCDDAVSRLSKKLGANHPYVAEAMVERALTLLAQGKPAKARHDITAALEVYRKSIGLTTVEAAKARAALGRTLLAMGKPHYDAAETDLRKAMATFSAIKLPRHPASLPALVDLATLMNKRGKTKDALRLVDKAFAVINAPEALVPSREVARIKALKTRLTPGH